MCPMHIYNQDRFQRIRRLPPTRSCLDDMIYTFHVTSPPTSMAINVTCPVRVSTRKRWIIVRNREREREKLSRQEIGESTESNLSLAAAVAAAVGDNTVIARICPLYIAVPNRINVSSQTRLKMNQETGRSFVSIYLRPLYLTDQCHFPPRPPSFI